MDKKSEISEEEFVEGIKRIVRKVSEGGDKVAVYNINGLQSIDIENLLEQPVEGVLYDLNSLEEVITAGVQGMGWVNRYALVKVFRWLYKRYKDSLAGNEFVENERFALKIQADIDSDRGILDSDNLHKEGYCGAMMMAVWKDKQMRDKMLRFFKWLDERGFIREDLQFDYEHQLETFLEFDKE